MEQTGCPTDTVNLSKYIINLLLGNDVAYGIHHFCGKKVMTWYGFAEYILVENNVSDRVNLVKAKNYRTLAERPKNRILAKSI